MPEKYYIAAIRLDDEIQNDDSYIKALPVVRSLCTIKELRLQKPVTFFVGENGTGKSTLLEGVAVCYGFNPEGGTVNFNFATKETHAGLHEYLRLVKAPRRPQTGFFLRAESFYNVSTELERIAAIPTSLPNLYNYYGGKSLHAQSHGESFMALVQNRFGSNGLYILDEPEAALSPTRQMALLALLHQLVQTGCQFIVATHSPILMAYPEAEIYELGQEGIRLTEYAKTAHYEVTRRFLENPGGMMAHLFEE